MKIVLATALFPQKQIKLLLKFDAYNSIVQYFYKYMINTSKLYFKIVNELHGF